MEDKKVKSGKDAKPWRHCIGPGLITGAADDDPSGIGTYSANGAQFGYGLLWLVPFCLPLMIAVQEMCGRVGAVTGKGLAAVIKRYYPRWLLWCSVILLVTANVFNIYADLNIMAASARMLLGVPVWLALSVIAGGIALLQIFVPYRHYAKILKWLCLSLLGYVVVAFLPGVRHDWAAVAHALVIPRLEHGPDAILAVVAFLGTTISPYLFFWQVGETVEEEVKDGHADRPGHRLDKVSEQEIESVRLDTVIGMLASQIVTFFIIVAAAGTLHVHGPVKIETAQDAAKALLPLGRPAYWLFTSCMLGTGLLAVPTLAGSIGYAVAETCGWRYGLYRRFSKARAFYLIIAASILLGYGMNFLKAISPVKALVYAAALNGVVAPPLIVILLLICNNRKIMGARANNVWSNIFGGAAALLMGAAALYLICGLFPGARILWEGSTAR
jgi:NRAMP (natural resistance-associated macrophage protein)-like metal ion transporter